MNAQLFDDEKGVYKSKDAEWIDERITYFVQTAKELLAVRNVYRTHYDFERVYSLLETLYISNRLHLPLKGILLVGY